MYRSDQCISNNRANRAHPELYMEIDELRYVFAQALKRSWKCIYPNLYWVPNSATYHRESVNGLFSYITTYDWMGAVACTFIRTSLGGQQLKVNNQNKVCFSISKGCHVYGRKFSTKTKFKAERLNILGIKIYCWKYPVFPDKAWVP